MVGPKIPILMYHAIPKVDDCRKHWYYCINTVPRVFAEQMNFLQEAGYRVISLGEVSRLMQKGETGQQRCVAITFDDGYEDFYTNAFPILSQHGFSATVFLPTAYIGSSAGPNGSACLTWKQVRELSEAGVDFGSHTVTHPQLHGLGPSELREEVRCSKEEIENELGAAVTSFSYPYAFPETDREFIGRLRELLHEADYRDGVSTIVGRAAESDNRLFMRRLPVNSHDDPRFFGAKLEGGYDWLHAVQHATKFFARKPKPSRSRMAIWPSA